MTKEEAKIAATILTAYSEGRMIQYLQKGRVGWLDGGKYLEFNFTDFCYRIKPTPTYRPWKPEEVPVGALLRHKHIKFGEAPVTMILCIRGVWVQFIDAQTGRLRDSCGSQEFFEDYEYSTDHGKTWLPCGVLET